MDKLPFFELEELLDSLKMLNEKEEEERAKKEKSDKAMATPNFSSMTSGMPKMPNYKL